LVVAALLVGPVAGSALAVWQRWNHSELRRTATEQVPPIAVEEANGDRGTYTLTLATAESGALVWDLMRGAGRQISDPLGLLGARNLQGWPGQLQGPDQADQFINQTAAAIVARNPGTAALDLATAGIGFVLASAADGVLTAALDATPGLTRLAESAGRVVWRVAPEGLELSGRQVDAAARLHLVENGQATALDSGPGTSISLDLPNGPAGRLVVLAERAANGWRATLEGEPLKTVGGEPSWTQTFELPAGGGELRIWYHRPWWLVATRTVILALAVLVAVPIRRTAVEREEF
jgi:hypothetical protein